MTATRTEKRPRYSRTSRKLQRLRKNATQSHTHSNAMNGISQRRFNRSVRLLQLAGRSLAPCRIMDNAFRSVETANSSATHQFRLADLLVTERPLSGEAHA